MTVRRIFNNRIINFIQGIEFDYQNKGKAIPPPKDRVPDTSNYYEVEPSPDAHVIQDAPEGYGIP